MQNPISVIRMLSKSRYLVRRLQTRFIMEETRGRSFDFVVDIGAGMTPYKKNLNFKSYVSVDIENRNNTADFVFGDLTKGIPLNDNVADLILCTEVLEHLPHHDIAIKELYRLLKPGGILLVTVPFVWILHEAPNDFYRFTNYGLHRLLASGGFQKINVKSSNNYYYTLLQLVVVPLRHTAFTPVVFFVNILGYMLGRLPATSVFPLNQHARADK